MHVFLGCPAYAARTKKLVLLALKPADFHAAVGTKAEDIRR